MLSAAVAEGRPVNGLSHADLTGKTVHFRDEVRAGVEKGVVESGVQ